MKQKEIVTCAHFVTRSSPRGSFWRNMSKRNTLQMMSDTIPAHYPAVRKRSLVVLPACCTRLMIIFKTKPAIAVRRSS